MPSGSLTRPRSAKETEHFLVHQAGGQLPQVLRQSHDAAAQHKFSSRVSLVQTYTARTLLACTARLHHSRKKPYTQTLTDSCAQAEGYSLVCESSGVVGVGKKSRELYQNLQPGTLNSHGVCSEWTHVDDAMVV